MAGILFFALALLACPYPLALLLALSIHEGAHIIAALLLQKELPRITFSLTGARLSYCPCQNTAKALAISLSGSFFGILIALLFWKYKAFALCSLGLSLVNLLPVSCLDGGGALQIILERIFLPDKAYLISRIASVSAVILFWGISVVIQLKAGGNITLLAVSVYLTVYVLCEKG